MAGLWTFSRTLKAWLVACLLAVFVATPLLDVVVCRDEAVAATHASDTGAPAVSDGNADLAHPDAGGVPHCIHGHCHHASVATATPTATLAAGMSCTDPDRPLASLVLDSIDPSLNKRPPRA